MSLTATSPGECTEHKDKRLIIILADPVVVVMSECPALEPTKRSSGKRGLDGVEVHVAEAALTWERSKWISQMEGFNFFKALGYCNAASVSSPPCRGKEKEEWAGGEGGGRGGGPLSRPPLMTP